MERPIVHAGDPVLRRRATEVDGLEAYADLVADMADTLRGIGVGLAAPQVGESLRLVLVEDPPELQAGVEPAVLDAQGRRPVPRQVLANPVIEPVGDRVDVFFEGCLSIPGWVMLVGRHRRVRCQALGVEPFVADGWHARILQHECDHLDGTLCIDRCDTRSLVSVASYRDRWRHLSIDEVRRVLDVS